MASLLHSRYRTVTTTIACDTACHFRWPTLLPGEEKPQKKVLSKNSFLDVLLEMSAAPPHW
jgi:hypothetical protein